MEDSSVTVDDFRELALSMPEAIESSHMDHPDFRVGGKIFATIWPDDSWGMVKLKPEQQAQFVKAEPKVFIPVKGGWGRKGATNVLLELADPTTVRNALVIAWQNRAPKKLLRQYDLSD